MWEIHLLFTTFHISLVFLCRYEKRKKTFPPASTKDGSRRGRFMSALMRAVYRLITSKQNLCSMVIS